MRQIGFENFTVDWIVTPGMSIYTIVIAGAWQPSGIVMALFLAGLRGVDDSIIKAAQVDGSGPVRIYTRILFPSLRSVLFSAFLRPAGNIHVYVRIQPQPDRPRRCERPDDDADRGGR